ncbi:MAG: phage tail terminator protein [Thalassovita sp.]
MLTEIFNHLSGSLPGETWAGVEIAEDIDVLKEMAGTVEDATVIIMPWGERAAPNSRATGGVLQRVEQRFTTGIVQRDFSGRLGGERATRTDSLKGDIEAALLGFEIPGFDEPCELIGGETSPISRGVSIYVQTWAAARFLTGE